MQVWVGSMNAGFLARVCLVVLVLGAIGREAMGRPDKSIKEAAEFFYRDFEFRNFGLSPDGSHFSFVFKRRDDFALRTFDIEAGKAYDAYGKAGESVYRYDWIDGDNLVVGLGVWGVFGVGKYKADENLRDFKLIGPRESSTSLGHEYAKSSLLMVDPLPALPGVSLLADRTGGQQFPDLYYFLQKSNTQRLAELNSGTDIDWVCDSHGDVRFVARMTTPGDVQWFYRSDKDSEWRAFGESGKLKVIDFDATGRNVFVVDDATLKLLDIDSGEVVGEPVTHPVFSCNPGLLRDRGTDKVVGAVFHWEKPNVVYYNPDYQNVQSMIQAQFPGMTCVVLGKAHGTSILVEVSSDLSPETVYSLDYGPRKALDLVMSQASWIRPEDCRPMEPISFAARDEVEVYGYLTRASSDSDQPGPTVMLVHGGPFSRDRWGFDREVQFLARLGYNVIQVNYRGSSGFRDDYSMRYEEARLLKVCEVSTRDIADAARWAIAEGIADPDRIAIIGGSFGGYAALAGAAFEPDLYKVAVGYAGVYDFDQELRSDYKGRAKVRTWLESSMGDIKNNPSLYADVSPVHFADQITADVLLIHGNADGVVDADQSKKMSRALKKAGKTHVLKITNWGNHGEYEDKERIKHGILVGEFLKKNL